MTTGPGTPIPEGHEMRDSLAAYVLGALGPEERDAVDAHVMECPDCAAELTRFAELPMLLDLVPADEVAAMGRPERLAHEALVERTVAAVVAERQQGRRRRRLVAVAAAVVLVAGAAGAGVAIGDRAGGGETGQRLAATDPVSHASATLWVRPAEWGTAVTLRLRGVQPGEDCQLVAIGKDGARSVAASWWATYHGSADVTGASGLSEPDTIAYDVVTLDGKRLVRVPTGVPTVG